MTLAGTVRMGRTLAEARMTQTWRVGTLQTTTDPDTFDVAEVLDAMYDGPARFKPAVWTTSEPAPGGQPIAVQAAELHLPAGTTGITVDMRAICDACPEDPSLVGRVVRIKGMSTAGQTTAARFPVEETGEVIEEGS